MSDISFCLSQLRPGHDSEGAVRLTEHELADLRWSRFSRGELTPFGERLSAVLLEDSPAVEVAVPIEMVVDRGVGSGELLQGTDVPESRHRSFSSPERLVRVLSSVVEPPTAHLIGGLCQTNWAGADCSKVVKIG